MVIGCIAAYTGKYYHPLFLLLLGFIWIQREETLFKGVLDKINLVGHDGHAFFFVDKDLAEMAKTGSNGSIMTDVAAQ